MAWSIVRTAGSGSIAIRTAALAARSASRVSAAIRTIGWPTWWHSSQARTSSSSKTGPKAREPGMSRSVSTATTPSTFEASATSIDRILPWAIGLPTKSTSNSPRDGGMSSM